jgi:GH15 family glucan-1,4-alpha-glucosidase
MNKVSLQSGATATLLLGKPGSKGQPSELQLTEPRFQETARFWKTWIAKSRYKGRWREMVHRSALMLKTHLALISAATYLDRALSGTLEAVWR